MKIKPTTPNTNPKARALGPRSVLRGACGFSEKIRDADIRKKLPAICHPWQAGMEAADFIPQTTEAKSVGSMQPALPEAALEQLALRVVRTARAVPVCVDPHQVVVSFHTGWMQGVTCAVTVEGRSVRLRLRAEGAVHRRDLLRGRRLVAGRLGSAGFDLNGYEVSP